MLVKTLLSDTIETRDFIPQCAKTSKYAEEDLENKFAFLDIKVVEIELEGHTLYAQCFLCPTWGFLSFINRRQFKVPNAEEASRTVDRGMRVSLIAF